MNINLIPSCYRIPCDTIQAHHYLSHYTNRLINRARQVHHYIPSVASTSRHVYMRLNDQLLESHNTVICVCDIQNYSVDNRDIWFATMHMYRNFNWKYEKRMLRCTLFWFSAVSILSTIDCYQDTSVFFMAIDFHM